MKRLLLLFSLLPILSCAGDKGKNYTGSTPAGPVIRSFMGIPLSDSIDFIRWKLYIDDRNYRLYCTYGIGKPNTNGFINGGKSLELGGGVKNEKNFIVLLNGDKKLKIAVLNDDLLHPVDEDNNLLVGTAGWSYTLGIPGSAASVVNTTDAQPTVLKDSLVFLGRTPCGIPGLYSPGTECYKLKWKVVLFAEPGKNTLSHYKIYGTVWRPGSVKSGDMVVIAGKNGEIIYQLNDAEKGFLYLLKLDENILVFTDANGNLLVGTEDFSYTLNRHL